MKKSERNPRTRVSRDLVSADIARYADYAYKPADSFAPAERAFGNRQRRRDAIRQFAPLTSTLVRATSYMLRLRIALQGTVQGVGFRPLVFRLANELGLAGWVSNSPAGVLIEVEGTAERLEEFRVLLENRRPPSCTIYSSETSWLDPAGYQHFEIRESLGGKKSAVVLPDLATCPACRAELFDPQNRRFRYPFINCTLCGPRFSIIEALPYDRVNTSMKAFSMCPECYAEYHNPGDRRFHAQPNACPICGPWVEVWDRNGTKQAEREEAITLAIEAIREGRIVGLKGIGGFQLIVDARNDDAVLRLRELKDREEKPFALMYPSLEKIKADCGVSSQEEQLLLSPAAPIVLLEAKAPSVCRNIAPGNPYLGVMLPYSPLHHLLMADLGFPVVATSGNAKDEPICTDENEAVRRLHNFVDLFLVHNRPIVRPVDDSIARIMMGREAITRRARGYAPLPITLTTDNPAQPEDVGVRDNPPQTVDPVRFDSVLAVGAHLKNTVALSVEHRVFLSQHLGDLETPEARNGFLEAVASLQKLYETAPVIAACDAHPDYESTRYAHSSGLPVVEVQHHFAHILSCMAENDLDEPVLGVSWDGTGYGLDGTVWGGEFLEVNGASFSRIAHLRTFRLPGGERAIREPRRTAIGLLFEIFGDDAFLMNDLPPIASFSPAERGILKSMLQRGINSPITSSAGRLFDAAAALSGVRQISTFEGQAAMELEFACAGFGSDEYYTLDLAEPSPGANRPVLINWEPLVKQLLEDSKNGVPRGAIAVRFHNALSEVVVAVARLRGQTRVVLSGGCFQNRYLTERTISRLTQEGFRAYWHQRVPPNDGGIALGQVAAVFRKKD